MPRRESPPPSANAATLCKKTALEDDDADVARLGMEGMDEDAAASSVCVTLMLQLRVRVKTWGGWKKAVVVAAACSSRKPPRISLAMIFETSERCVEGKLVSKLCPWGAKDQVSRASKATRRRSDDASRQNRSRLRHSHCYTSLSLSQPHTGRAEQSPAEKFPNPSR